METRHCFNMHIGISVLLSDNKLEKCKPTLSICFCDNNICLFYLDSENLT